MFTKRHLQGIGGSRDVGFGQKRVRSVPDAIARALHTYLESKSQMPKVEDSLVPIIQSVMEGGDDILLGGKESAVRVMLDSDRNACALCRMQLRVPCIRTLNRN